MKKNLIPILLIALMMNASCEKPKDYGRLQMQTSYTVNGKPLVTNDLCYTNEAGNQYLVTEIQWFLSNITLQNEQGEVYTLTHREAENLANTPLERVFYIDTNLPGTGTLAMAPIPCGRYVALRFTFGLDEQDNRTGLFTDPPESNMFWPEPLGGGYHYMKLNGKYLDGNGQLAPLNIHLGIGQDSTLTTFYQNAFTVELPIDLEVLENEENILPLNMNIDNWFCGPHSYDFQTFGSAIMQNQEAQQLLKENGHDVFSIVEESTPLEKMAGTLKGIFHKAAPKPHFYTKKNMKALLSEITSRKGERP